MKGELEGLVAVVVSWLSGLWRVQSDTLGSSPTVAGLFSSPFSLSRLSSN